MITFRILLLKFFIKYLSCKYVIESSSITPDYPVVAVLNNCSKFYLNTFYDLGQKSWIVNEHSSCLNSKKDVLAYCQRVYPDYKVVNILKTNKNALFLVKFCEDTQNFQYNDESTKETATVYKCLNGKYTPIKMYVPKNCIFHHFFSDKECQSDEGWTMLMNQKCKSIKSYLHDFNFLQWCDAFLGGISSFNGVEFSCCNLTIDSKMNEANINEDEDIDYLNDVLVTKVVLASDKASHEEKNDIYSPNNSNRGFVIFLILAVISVVITFYIFKRKFIGEKNQNRQMVPVEASNNETNNLQVNGYENPTYKYFELSS